MSDYIVEMRHITKRFPGIVANDDVTIQVKKGEIYALLGENGAGKSTLMSMLFGMYEPDEGEIYIRGEKVKISSPNHATKLNIGMVIVTIGVVDSSIGAHSIGHKLLPDKVLQQFDLLLTAQFNGQRHDELTGKSAVFCCFHFLHGVPELFSVFPFLRAAISATSSTALVIVGDAPIARVALAQSVMVTKLVIW